MKSDFMKVNVTKANSMGGQCPGGNRAPSGPQPQGSTGRQRLSAPALMAWLCLMLWVLTACADVAVPSAPQPGAIIASSSSTLPRALATHSLPGGLDVLDALYDPVGDRYFVSDIGGGLFVLNAADLTLAASAPEGGGLLTLDIDNARLYAATGQGYVPEDAEPRVLVYDLARLTDGPLSLDAARIGRIAPARYVAVDVDHARLFTSEGTGFSNPSAGAVTVLDAVDFAPLGQIPQAGIPVYNPLRNDLLIVNHTVYVADPETGAVVRDLFPDLTAEIPFLFCSGCPWIDWVRLFADEGLIAVNLQGHAPQGAGAIAPLTWLDARTLDPLSPAAPVPELQADCGSGGALRFPDDNRIIRGRRYVRYVVYTNLLVTDAAGAALTWRDGLPVAYVNTRTDQVYLADGRVLDAATLAPVGQWPRGCVFVARPDVGHLLTATGSELTLTADGGGSLTAPPPEPTALPATAVTAIHPSPDYANDGTLIVSTGGALYRSTDGSATWVRLQGGLPADPELTLDARFSPAFAADRTLYAFGFRRDYGGDGVWRSVDGGDGWAPVWTGLLHLRTRDLRLSAGFAHDQTLVAEAPFFHVDSGQGGVSFHRSTDGGLTWTTALTVPSGMTAPPIESLLPADAFSRASDSPVRVGEYGRTVERLGDDGVWHTADLALQPDELVRAIVAVPGDTQAPTAYVLTDLNLLRTVDGGATWERWGDARLAGRTFADDLEVLAVAAADAQDGHHLFVGTADGEVWPVDPADTVWQALSPSVDVESR